MTKSSLSSPLLYVYGANSMLSALKRGRLSLQHDWRFLEPFLSLHQWHTKSHHAVTESEMLMGFRREYEKLPQSVQMWLSFDDFLSQKDKLASQVKTNVLANRKHQDLPAYPLKRFEKSAFLRLFDSSTCHFGWFMLANEFTGICIALRQQASCLQPMPGAPVVLQPVQYDALHQFQPTADNPLPGAFLDVAEHQSRGEWRAIVPTRGDNSIALKVKRHDIQRIYVSVLTPETVVSELKQLVQQDLNFRHVDLYCVSPDVNYWRLTADRIPTN